MRRLPFRGFGHKYGVLLSDLKFQKQKVFKNIKPKGQNMFRGVNV